jgi:hypothetical protein
MGNISTAETGQWSSSTVTPLQPQNIGTDYSEGTPTPAQSPWNSQAAQVDGYGIDASAGCVTFEPDPGLPYDTFKLGEEFLQNDRPMLERFGPESAVSPVWDGESEGWHVVPSYPPSSVPSHDSPQSLDSSWSHVGSPLSTASSTVQHTENHSHVFSAYLSEPKSAPARGRQRALTSQEKQEALVVRKAKACWACHLSKIKVNV